MTSVPECPCLRPELEILAQASPGNPGRHVIKDNVSAGVYEFTEKEIFLCRQFDGTTPRSAVIGRFRARFHLELVPKQLESFVRQLAEQGLLTVPMEDKRAKPWGGMKLLPVDADRLMHAMARVFAWGYTWRAHLAFLVVIWVAVLIIGGHWASIMYQVRNLLHAIEMAGYSGSFSIEGIVQISFFLVILPFFRELAKGATCRHYGFRVPEIRYGWHLHFIPRCAANLKSLARMSRNQQIHVLVSGMLLDLLLISLGTFIGEILNEDNPIKFVAHSLIIGASIRFFFNANPFGKQDGSFLLSILLKIPDMRIRALDTWRAWLLFRPDPEPLSRAEKRFFIVTGMLYDTCALVIDVAILSLLGYLLTCRLEGLGAVIFLAFVGLKYEDHIRRLFMGLFSSSGTSQSRKRWWRGTLIWVGILVVVGAALLLIKCPFEACGEFRVQPFLKREIRAEVSSFIDCIPVDEGAFVKSGELMVQLSRRLIEKDLNIARASLRREEQELRELEAGPRLEEIARADQKVKLAETAYLHSEKRLKRGRELHDKEHIPDQEYENLLRQRDVDRETWELAKRERDLIKAGSRIEDIEAQRAEVDRLRVTAEHLEGDLVRTAIASPIDGQISTLYLKGKIGQTVNVGDVVAIVENSSNVIIRVAVPEEYAAGLETGASVCAKAWAYSGMTFTGRVTVVAPVAIEKSEDIRQQASVEQEQGMVRNLSTPQELVVPILAQIDNGDGLLKSEMTGYAKIKVGRRSLGYVLFHPVIRFLRVRVWSWIP